MPIFRTDVERRAVEQAIQPVERALADAERRMPDGQIGSVRVHVDRRQETPGFKFNDWELRGVPFRLEIGPREVAAGTGVLVKRVDRSKETVPLDALAAMLPARLDAYQREVFERAVEFRQANTHRIDTLAALRTLMDGEGGFASAPWCGTTDCETTAAEETGATIRVIPFESPDEPGVCIVCGGPSERRALFARAY